MDEDDIEGGNPSATQLLTNPPSPKSTSPPKARQRHFNKTSNSMFVSNLDSRVTEEILAELFTFAGPVEDVFIPTDAQGASKRFGFVEFCDESAVSYAQYLLDGVMLFSQPIRVKPALNN